MSEPQTSTPPPDASNSELKQDKTLPERFESQERTVILEAYRKLGNSYKVAQSPGISQPSAARKIKKYMESDA